jgi:NADPH-dependent glutamate synthase beta subunit-like oxidoreductase/ActR/RegA family two-component response regulator/Pyruvate/2-oxoacid:ferredoxin oxidoreductase delta subunit
MKPILVVDDEAVVRESLRDWLTEDGYQVEIAEDGDTALNAIGKQDFGVAIVDLMLPGKNGIEVLREARVKSPHLKGIIITAYASVPTAVEALKNGAIDYLPKPVQLNQLEVLISDVLGPAKVEVKPEAAAAPAKVRPPVAEAEEPTQVEEMVDEATGKIYLPPCQIACPVGEDIQRTNAMISMLPLDIEEAQEQIIRIGDEIYKKNPLFPVCSYICGLCEKECNYKDHTGAIRRKMLKRFISEYYLPYLETKPALPSPTREKVAVIGGGPGGLMCAYMLGQSGYRVTVLERDSRLGGALRYIPQYRLPAGVINSTLNNLVRIAHVDVRFGVDMGRSGNTLDGLEGDGYQAVFVATGTHAPRPLTLERDTVLGADMDGVISGLYLLYDMNQGKIPAQLYRQLFRHKKVVVVGGGNVAFDVARTARRLGGDVAMVCLENEDKSTKDGIPADVEEIEGAIEEGIMINYSRGVEEIMGEKGRFKAIKCPRCTSVFDVKGFNPKFDRRDIIYLEGDVLLITIGQGAERTFFRQEGLLDETGRLDVDHLTLMSHRREGVFIGGDVRRVGFAAEAMRDGIIAAESIDRYLKGEDLESGREKEFEDAAFPKRLEYKPQPEILWSPAEDRLNFETFEQGYRLEEAVAEARRCLCCGPCSSCKACVVLGIQSEIPPIVLNQDLCSGCGVCVAVCPYEALKMVSVNGGRRAVIDTVRCKRCGLCVSTCPSEAISIENFTSEKIRAEIEAALL